MDYEEKYETALERAKGIINYYKSRNRNEAAIEDLQEIFPELKESEDEKIRETLIKFHKSTIDIDGIKGYDILSWLEKQGKKPQGKSALEAIEEEKVDNANKIEAKPKFKVGDWITDGDYTWKVVEVKPLDYILQSQDGGIVDDTISYVDGQFHCYCSSCENVEIETTKIPFGAKDSELMEATYFIPKGFHVEIVDNKVIIKKGEQKPTIEMITPEKSLGIDSGTYNKIVDECIYGEQKPADTYCKEHCKGYQETGKCYADGSCDAKIKAGQKPVDKVEQEFHEGDWVVYKNDICQIVKREEGCNKLVTVFGIEKELVNERNLSTARLWNIKDAKNGDILVDNYGNILIYKEYSTGKYYHSYCYGKDTFTALGGGHPIEEVQPATKEQRNTLIKVMTDAGWEFDFEKKELNKIEKQSEQKLAWSEADEYLLGETTQHLEELIRIDKAKHCACDVQYYQRDIDWLKSLKKRIVPQQKGWSKDDEQIALSIGQVMNCAALLNIVPEKISKIRTWLHSLKHRVIWKPTEEQLYWLRYAADSTSDTEKGNEVEAVLKELYEQLKKIKEE